jgi:hypothetical protein
VRVTVYFEKWLKCFPSFFHLGISKTVDLFCSFVVTVRFTENLSSPLTFKKGIKVSKSCVGLHSAFRNHIVVHCWNEFD